MLDLSARNGVRIRCGEGMIELTKDGVEIKGNTITIAAKKMLSASGKGPTQGETRLRLPWASIRVDGRPEDLEVNAVDQDGAVE